MQHKQRLKRFARLKLDRKSLAKHTKKAEIATTQHAHRFIIKKLANLQLVRQHIVLWLLIVGGLIGATALQMHWTNRAYHQVSATTGGTYAEAIQGEIDTLNPLYARSQAERSAQKLLFSQLLDYDETGRLRNDLASGVAVDAANKRYTVTLRDDARWSDGKPVTADDVVFTVALMKNIETSAVMRASWLGVSATAVSPYTVEFRLKTAYAPFVDALTFAVLPKHVLQGVPPGNIRENSFSVSPITSGPMRFKLLQSVDENKKTAHKIVYMVANEEYYRGTPKLQRFELHAYDTTEGMLHAAKSRDVNALVNLDRSQLQDVPKTFTTSEHPINSGAYVFFNMDSRILADKKVRQALLLGTDISALKATTYPLAPALSTPFIPNQLDSQVKINSFTQNTKTAKKLLSAQKWKVGKNSTIRTKKKQQLRLKVVANKEAEYSKLLEDLRSQWSKLGVAVDIVEFEEQPGGENFAQAVLQRRDYDVLINELSFGSDPDVFAYWHSSQAAPAGLNFSNYRSEIADDILTSARVRNDKRLRDEKYKSFARQWRADMPALPIAQSTLLYTHAGQAQAFSRDTILPTTSDRYGSILYWSAEQRPVYKTP